MALLNIRVERHGGQVRVLVGDVEIPPEAIDPDSLNTWIDPDEVPSLELKLIGGRVDIVDTPQDPHPAAFEKARGDGG